MQERAILDKLRAGASHCARQVAHLSSGAVGQSNNRQVQCRWLLDVHLAPQGHGMQLAVVHVCVGVAGMWQARPCMQTSTLKKLPTNV